MAGKSLRLNLACMFTATTASGVEDLQHILQLQEKNLIRNLSSNEMKTEGFVTINHSLEMLEQMHRLAPSIIIKDDNKVLAYALTMLCAFSKLVPGLESMFERFDSLEWKNKPLTQYDFYVMGQICIDKAYRGQGLFDSLYEKHKEVYAGQFDFIITEIATRNHRSINAHKRVGFETIHTYKDHLDEWNVVVLDYH